MNFDNFLFRASSTGYLMTESRSKTDPISETTKTHLIDCYISAIYGRREDISNKYIQKGLQVEEDSITLYSRHKKTYYKKNESRLSNNWIMGTPDLFEGETIETASHIIDIKSSWDIYTFFRNLSKDMNKAYYWQLQSYMDLTGAKSATLAYCLVNTPEIMIEDEKRKLAWKMGIIDPSGNSEYEDACAEIERSMIFDDIPINERVIEFKIERNDEDIEKLHKRVEICRTWLNEFQAKNRA